MTRISHEDAVLFWRGHFLLGAHELRLLAHRHLLAIAAVTDIAIHTRHEPAASKDIASRLDLPNPRSLESVLQALAGKGILAGTRGPNGGYRLACEPSSISLDDILRAVSDADIGHPSAIEREPALRRAEEAFSQALRRLTVDVLVRDAEKR
jgi:Rrf2 family protein